MVAWRHRAFRRLLLTCPMPRCVLTTPAFLLLFRLACLRDAHELLAIAWPSVNGVQRVCQQAADCPSSVNPSDAGLVW